MSNIKHIQHWYKGSVVYQIYPRSFQDTTGNGVGDLRGVINRLDYLGPEGLGIDAIWLSPFYPSPMADFGYDVKDYCNVDPLFGSLEDFDELLVKSHQLGIKVLIDLVPNHTSDEHPWFLQSRSSITSDKRDWYVWRRPSSDGGPPNNWLSVFGGSAWQYDEHTDQYYLHSFLKQQPDLNWENPKVREAIANVIRFWISRGVDGFRVDATDHIGKQADMADEPINNDTDVPKNPYDLLDHIYSKNAGNYHKHMHFIASLLSNYPDKIAIFETWMQGARKTELLLDFYNYMPKPNAMPFNFELMDASWDAEDFKRSIDAFQAGLSEDHLPVYVLSNHDRPRFPSRIGHQSVRAAALLELTLPGIALIYYGDEIGMEDAELDDKDIKDPFGKTNPEYGRDVARSPMQWDDSQYAGFSTTEPWLPIHSNHKTVNVATEQASEISNLALYKKLVRLRKEVPALRYGLYQPLEQLRAGVLGFDRQHNEQKIRVLINFTDQSVDIPDDLVNKFELLLSTSLRDKCDATLAPNEGIILQNDSR